MSTMAEAAIRADMEAQKLQFSPADLTVAIERIKTGKITDAKPVRSPPRVDQVRENDEESDEKTDTTSDTTSNSNAKPSNTTSSIE